MRSTRVLLSLAALLVLALLSGCLGTAEPVSRGALGDPGSVGDAAPGASAQTGPEQQGPSLRERVQRLLDRRARAVRRGDEAAFMRQVGGSRQWQERQRQYFRNVVQLPWREFGYDVQDDDWQVAVRERGGAQVLVPRLVQRTRIEGIDRLTVRRVVGFVMVVRGDRIRLVDDHGLDGDRLLEGAPAPWDLVRVHVRREGGVIGVFDDAMVGQAPELMGVLSRGVDEVAAALPYPWSRRVAAYVVGDRTVLDSFTDVPGGSVDLLGAMTFPTFSEPQVSPVASTRMLLLPSSVAAGEPFLGRITRHEISHVALGDRDDGTPTWFSEGLAEYLGARTVPTSLRRIPTEAVRLAARPVGGLPASADFNGPAQDWHYALSWMAVEVLVEREGEGVLWRLLDAMDPRQGPETDERGAEVLREVAGIGQRRLARLAAQRITRLYG